MQEGLVPVTYATDASCHDHTNSNELHPGLKCFKNNKAPGAHRLNLHLFQYSRKVFSNRLQQLITLFCKTVLFQNADKWQMWYYYTKYDFTISHTLLALIFMYYRYKNYNALKEVRIFFQYISVWLRVKVNW